MQQVPFFQSIRGKLTIANAAVVVVLVGICVLATVQFVKVAGLVSVVSDGSEVLMHLTHVLDERAPLIESFQRGYGEQQDQASRARFTALVDDLVSHAEQAGRLSTPEERGAITQAEGALRAARTRVQALETLPEDEREVAVIELEEALSDAMGGFAQAKLASNKGMESRLATVKVEVKRPLRIFWIAAGIGVLGALAVSVFMRRRVSRPISDLSVAVNELGSGRATQISATSTDELGQLARGFNTMASTIVERTRSLKLVLDSVGDGLVSCDRDGRLVGEPSLRALEWFGAPKAGVDVWTYIGEQDPKFSGQFALGFAQLVEDLMPFELSAYQMPREVERDGKIFALSYRQVIEDEVFTRVLIVISDVTEQRLTARKEREQRDVYSLASIALSDPDAYAEFCSDTDKRFARALTGEHVMFELHTIKGNAGVIGCEHFAHHVHEVETAFGESGFSVERVEALKRHWEMLGETAERAAGRSAAGAIVVPRPEYDRLLRLLQTGGRLVDAEVLARSWSMHRVGNSLSRLARTAQRYAEREGKEVTIAVRGGDLSVSKGILDEFWGCLIHLVKNAVAHGIEPTERRVDQGKSAQGNIELAAQVQEGHLMVVVGDDGGGIDWQALAAKDGSGASGLELLTRPGVSTAQETTDLAGRGVGFGAVAKVVEELGGRVEVESELGRGTKFKVHLPIANDSTYVPKPSLVFNFGDTEEDTLRTG